jgi:hypothetical protein
MEGMRIVKIKLEGGEKGREGAVRTQK